MEKQSVAFEKALEKRQRDLPQLKPIFAFHRNLIKAKLEAREVLYLPQPISQEEIKSLIKAKQALLQGRTLPVPRELFAELSKRLCRLLVKADCIEQSIKEEALHLSKEPEILSEKFECYARFKSEAESPKDWVIHFVCTEVLRIVLSHYACLYAPLLQGWDAHYCGICGSLPDLVYRYKDQTKVVCCNCDFAWAHDAVCFSCLKALEDLTLCATLYEKHKFFVCEDCKSYGRLLLPVGDEPFFAPDEERILYLSFDASLQKRGYSLKRIPLERR